MQHGITIGEQSARHCYTNDVKPSISVNHFVSEATVTGSQQLQASGKPILFSEVGPLHQMHCRMSYNHIPLVSHQSQQHTDAKRGRPVVSSRLVWFGHVVDEYRHTNKKQQA